MTATHDNPAQQLAEARQVIQRQAREIEELKGRQSDSVFAGELREMLLATASAGLIASPAPHREALRAIVETAVEVLGAQAAALFLVDEPSGQLMFEVALGGKAEEVSRFRLEPGQGFAGFVAATGQPLAVVDALQDSRFAREIAEAIDYIPKSVLCVPLMLEYRVIGVLELLDKEGGIPFTTRDMETLGRFATLAAQTIAESRLTHDMRHLFRSLLADAAGQGALGQPAAGFAERAAALGERDDAIRLAGLIRELCRQGEGARRMAVEVMTALTRHLSASSVE